MNKIDVLIAYKTDLEKIIEREEKKLQKENEKNQAKYDAVIADYPSEYEVMNAYGYAMITERKKDQLLDIIRTGGPNAPTCTPYLTLLKRDLKNISLEITYPENTDYIECVSDPRVVELEKEVEELKETLKIEKDSSRSYVDQWVDRNLKLIDENKQLTLKLKELQNKSVSIKHNARGAGRSKRFNDEQIAMIKMYSFQGKKLVELSKMFECSTGLISNILNDK